MDQPVRLDDALTASEVASALGVSYRSVLALLKGKKLRGYKVGAWKVRKEDLAAYLRRVASIPAESAP